MHFLVFLTLYAGVYWYLGEGALVAELAELGSVVKYLVGDVVEEMVGDIVGAKVGTQAKVK